jgi:hypothetical protein
VSPLALRRLARRLRGRGIALLAVCAIGGAMAVHHSDLAMMHDDGGMSAAMELCLGVFVAVGTAAAAMAVAFIGLAARRPPGELAAVGLSVAVEPPEPRARAGPALLSLLCISRR